MSPRGKLHTLLNSSRLSLTMFIKLALKCTYKKMLICLNATIRFRKRIKMERNVRTHLKD